MNLALVIELLTACSASAAFAVTHAASSVPSPPRPRSGHRGTQRASALAASAGFRLAEPVMRKLAGWIGVMRVLSPEQQRALERRLVWSGQYLGLDASELVALTLLAAAGAAIAAFPLCSMLEESPWVAAAATLGAACLPWLSVRSQERQRTRAIERRLPGALDLAVLCVGAGMDLRSALELITRHGTRDALSQELERVLGELAVGRTREQALGALAARVRSNAVREFTTAVIQAELKGTPLADALAVQATVARGRRSVAAEEAAARASVLLTLPLMLLLCCVLLLLFGPFLVNGGL